LTKHQRVREKISACNRLDKFLNSALAVALRHLARFVYPNEWAALRANAAKLAIATRLDPKFERLQPIFDALVMAEDRRFYSHAGVDLRAIFRAILILMLSQQLQGGSTITQQLVRTLTQDYARTVKRKYKEVLLAALLDEEINKVDQIRSYLAIAYFGWRMNGIHQALRRQGFSPPLSTIQAAQIIARLKYPEPRVATPSTKERIERRAAHIAELIYTFQKNENEQT